MNHHCDQNQFLRWIEDETSMQDDQDALEHLGNCAACQRQLETMAADEWWWSDGRDFVASSETVEMNLDASRIIPTTGKSEELGASLEKWSIDFLDPPTQPELLGRLGKYHIEGVIGHGGMGIVLRGFDSELNRTVAIKVLAPHLASCATARKRFAREAKAAAAVVHDHVVAIHGIETNGELPYIVMPFVSGLSLQKYVEQHGPFSTKDTVRIAMQIAAGLSAAHEQGLVHRDIKPANILLEDNVGRVLITDFGLARAADDASITRSGIVAGTPHYMSPEQANGDPVDARSDQFSLGSVIYFMITGRAPFRGDGPMAVLHAICRKEALQLRAVDPEIPRPIEQLVCRLLSKEPRERFDSAKHLRHILAGYLAHLQSPLQAKLPKELSTRSSRFGIASLVCAVLLVIASIAIWGYPNEPNSQSTIPTSDDRQSTQPIQIPSSLLTTPYASSDSFDQGIQSLAIGLREVEREWDADRQDVGSVDPWDKLHDSLESELDELEQSWSGTPDE